MTQEEWDGSFEADRRRKQEAWARMSAGELLQWLEDALTFAADAGALHGDRELRAEEARRLGERLAGR